MYMANKTNSNLEELNIEYKKLRNLSAKLVDLNIKQVENQISKENAYEQLYLLIELYNDVEEKIFNLESKQNQQTK